MGVFFRTGGESTKSVASDSLAAARNGGWHKKVGEKVQSAYYDRISAFLTPIFRLLLSISAEKWMLSS